jgi:large subunit ribosomal protein L5e
MGLVKVQKNKAYYKRLQTKYRRRRNGKTDFYARKKMVCQEKNKYNSPKYRLVVRRTNRRVICQIVYSTIVGDRVLTQATSPELEKYGVPVGHANYAAYYATGLLVARRALKLLKMDEEITGVEEVDAEEYHVEDSHEGEKRPFKCILDLGCIRTVTGARIFGALKGAVDGGLNVPHKVRKFPGYGEPEERGMEYTYDAGAHLERILGAHVQEYVEMLQEEDQERYKIQFAKIIENDIEADGMEDMYRECHTAIRENPVFEKAEDQGITNKVEGNKTTPSTGDSYTRLRKMSYKQKKDRVKQKIQSAQMKMAGKLAADEDDE